MCSNTNRLTDPTEQESFPTIGATTPFKAETPTAKTLIEQNWRHTGYGRRVTNSRAGVALQELNAAIHWLYYRKEPDWEDFESSELVRTQLRKILRWVPEFLKSLRRYQKRGPPSS